jgi:hypothetical protein
MIILSGITSLCLAPFWFAFRISIALLQEMFRTDK